MPSALHLCELDIEMKHGLSQPYWVTMTHPMYENRTTIDLLSEMMAKIKNNLYSSPEKAKLLGGLLVNKILTDARNAPLSTPFHMNFYSSHATTLTALFYALNASDGHVTPYAGCLILELRKIGNERRLDVLISSFFLYS
ncbi:hypothetical protein AB6A40_011172, partial [Gnathostoma spinigerum]